MAITIDSDPASANANAYADQDFAASYFETRLYSSSWLDAHEEERKAALVQATRLLDSMVDWSGVVVSETQPLAWPRNYVQQRDRNSGTYLDPDSADFPTFLREVCCEVAHDMLVEDRMADAATGLSSLRVDVIGLTFDETDRKDFFSDTVIQMIGKYGKVKKKTGGVVSLVRA